MNDTKPTPSINADPVTEPQHGFCGHCYPFETTIVHLGDVLTAVCGAEVPAEKIEPTHGGVEEALQPPSNACADCMVADACTKGHS